MSFHLAWCLDEVMEESKFLGLPCPPCTADRSHQDTPGHIPVLCSWCLAGTGLWMEVNRAWVILEEREVLCCEWEETFGWAGRGCACHRTQRSVTTPELQWLDAILTSLTWWQCRLSLVNVSWWFSLSLSAPDCDFGFWLGQGNLRCAKWLGMQLKCFGQVRTLGMPEVKVDWDSLCGLQVFSSVSGWALPRAFFES